MQRRLLAVVLACFILGASATIIAQEQSSALRKLVSSVTPAYPSLARTMRISGIVRVEAVVGSNGTVKTVEILGGNPVLVEAAKEAVIKWKWEPAVHETREPVTLKFEPQ